MKDFFKNIQNILIVVLVVIILIMRSCSGGSNDNVITEPTTITKIEVSYDTIETVIKEYVPQWRDKIIIETDTIPAEVDTLSILKNYYAKYIYTDTLKIDTIGYAIVNDTITQNTIASRNVTTNFLIPTITQTNTVYINKNEIYWGLGLQGRKDQLNYLGGELLFRSKTKNVYGFGLGINENLQPVLSGRMYWKIGK